MIFWFRLFPGNWRIKVIGWLLKDDEKFLLAQIIDLRISKLTELYWESKDYYNIAQDIQDLRKFRKILSTKEYK